jgi:cellulose biosynthesis protein BcsQ
LYDTIFIDTNPSFSIYTQIALSSCENIILPVMADDSSRRAVQNVFSLVYGIKLPSEIYTKFAFAHKLKEKERVLPKIKLILKNRITQYM